MPQILDQPPLPVYDGPEDLPFSSKRGFPSNRPLFNGLDRSSKIELPPLPTLAVHGHRICPTHQCKSTQSDLLVCNHDSYTYMYTHNVFPIR